MTVPARHDELSTTLHNLRTDADLPQTEAARRAEMSQPTISRLETGAQMPTEAEVERLCDYVRGIGSRSFKHRDVNPTRRS